MHDRACSVSRVTVWVQALENNDLKNNALSRFFKIGLASLYPVVNHVRYC